MAEPELAAKAVAPVGDLARLCERPTETQQTEFWFVGDESKKEEPVPALIPVETKELLLEPVVAPKRKVAGNEAWLPLSTEREGLARKTAFGDGSVNRLGGYAQKTAAVRYMGLVSSLHTAGALDQGCTNPMTRFELPGSGFVRKLQAWGSRLFGTTFDQIVRSPPRGSRSHGPPRADGYLA